jgi:hypothetical protein
MPGLTLPMGAGTFDATPGRAARQTDGRAAYGRDAADVAFIFPDIARHRCR